MKLKKIASLMLAGIMAVSMLAGCKSGTPDPDDNGGASSNTTSSFTNAVLAETLDVTQLRLTANTNNKLREAVEWTAKNNVPNSNFASEDVTPLGANDPYVVDATTVMNGAYQYTDFSANQNAWSFSPASLIGGAMANSDSETFWSLGAVKRTVTDELIAKQVAGILDTLAEDMVEDGQEANGCTWDYSVSVAIADSLAGDDATRADDVVIVGVAITVNKTAVEY